jgi:hypothetical protein
MATKKVKKFGRGGDILTALGAGLAGYGAYKYFTKDKDDIKSDGRSSGLIRRDTQPDISEEKPSKKAEPVATETEGERRAKAVSQGRPEMGDVTSDMKSDEGVKRADAKKTGTVYKQGLLGGGSKKSQSATTTPPATKATDKAGTGDEVVTTPPPPVVKKTPHEEFLSKKAGLSGKGITTPGSGTKKGSTAKGRSENPIQGTIDNRSKSMARTPQQKMSEGAREVQRRREEAEKSRYKKGGAVKSASSRADGIALRGKTRGKVY